MQHFKNVLFLAPSGVDHGAALGRAVALSRANEARLTVMDVVESDEELAAEVRQVGLDFNGLLCQRRQEELEALTSPHGATAPIALQVLTGTPFIEVIRAVQRHGYDLLIKAAEGLRGRDDRVLGSTDLHLLRKTPCPVWIDRPGQTRPYRTLLAAVDPVGDAVPGTYRRIMDLATSLANREGAELHVVHAWSLPGESLLAGDRGHIQPSYLQKVRDTVKARHQARLAWLVALYGLSLDRPSVHLLEGQPATVIPEVARKIGADLIVMGTTGRVGIPGFFIGGTAEEVLGSTQCSVLAVKPEGFVSPVTPD